MHTTNETRRKYDRWVIVPISVATVASALVSFAANGLIGTSVLHGSKETTSLVDFSSLTIGAVAIVASWIVLWMSNRKGNKN